MEVLALTKGTILDKCSHIQVVYMFTTKNYHIKLATQKYMHMDIIKCTIPEANSNDSDKNVFRMEVKAVTTNGVYNVHIVYKLNILDVSLNMATLTAGTCC